MSFSIILLAGCAATILDYQRASTGRVPCSPTEIEISNIDKFNLGSTWVATCKGKKYYCTSKATSTGSGGFTSQTACAPE